MKGQREYTKEQEELIIELYINQKRGQRYVCKMAHTTPEVMKKFLTKRGYKIRNFSEAVSISNQNRAKHKKQDYFSKENESHNMAWLLGFIASDGTVRKDTNEIKVTLSSVDREILEKIREELELETEVKDYLTNTGFNCSTLAWTCGQHKKDLERYNIVPNKTFSLLPPDELDKEYWIDYIRGYFDGDGSVNLIAGQSLRWQVCSATKPILEFIVDTLYTQYNIPQVNLQKQNRNGKALYSIQYSTNATKAIYDILYTPNSLYLNRKKEHYKSILMK